MPRRHHLLPSLLASNLLLGLLGCGGERTSQQTPPSNKPPPTVGPTCGNNNINGLEPCDGAAFKGSRSCVTYNLGTGNVSCSASCTLNFASCGFPDYCTANNLYANGQCDNCDLLGGVADPECITACAADGRCGDRFDELTATWSCKRRGMMDPDCGTCGNQIIEGNELCDGMTFLPGKNRCENWGYQDGSLDCNNCLPVFTGCRAASCGDNVIEGPERCEANDLRGASCTGLGFAGGNVTCTSTCGVSASACVAPGCGNSILEPGRGEECEGSGVGTATCQSRGFAGGNLSCDASCHISTASCISPGCNNGIIEAVEECEGSNLNGGTCMGEGFLGGNLSCSATSCTYNTAMCVAPGCGNMILEPATEQCEGGNLNGATCVSRGYAGGNLACNSSCQFEFGACVQPGCGNMIIEAGRGEQCEGTNYNGQTCVTQGFGGGAIACDSSCHFVTSGCSAPPVSACGDGVARGLEPCDGSDFLAPATCADYSMGTGSITCSQCHLVFTGCSGGDFCQVNNFYSDGVCDNCQVYGGTTDPDCTNGCGSNGSCVSYFDSAVGDYTCISSRGAQDPDCGCGNGSVEPARADGLTQELCDGSQFQTNPALTTCAAYGYAGGGTLSCSTACKPTFANCIP